MPGSYILVIRSERQAVVSAGRLGTVHLKRGWYLYVGSAFGPGGLAARLAHHLRPSERRHWHIDYLLDGRAVREVWYRCGARDLEHHWAQALLTHPAAQAPVAGFGATDCRCRSHLIGVARRQDLAAFKNLLSPTVWRLR